MYTLGFLSLAFLLLPHLLFGLGWLTPPLAVVYVGATCALLWRPARLAREEWRAARKQYRALALSWLPAILLTILWVSLSGTGGIGYQNGDYSANNSLFKDLIVRAWPVEYDTVGASADGLSFPLVYYVAYYLPAAVVGKVLGWEAANIAIFAWTCLGVLLAIAWAAMIAGIPRTIGASVVLVLVYMLFGGLDWFGVHYTGQTPLRGDHVEWWAALFQYSSHTTQLFWVPQHALAPWLATGAVVATFLHRSEFDRFVLVLPVACLLWSPFSTVGLTPIAAVAAYLAWRRGVLRRVFSPELLLAVGVIGSVTALFMLSNRFGFPKGFIFHTNTADFEFGADFAIETLVAFWLLEFGVLVFLFRRRGSLPPDLRIWAAVAVMCLLLIPVYRMGRWNDFAMRSSIPALFILCVAAVVVLFNERALALQRIAILIVLGLGSLTALSEVVRCLANYHIGPPPEERVLSFAEQQPRYVVQRSGSHDSIFFRYLARHPPRPDGRP